MSSERVAIIHNSLGLALHSKRYVELAAGHYRKAIDVEGQDPRAHNNLGVAMQDLGQVEEAKKCYRRAAEIDPQHHLAEANLSALLRSDKITGWMCHDRTLARLATPRWGLADSAQ